MTVKISKRLAVDFDGTLCTANYPNLGRQLLIHKIVAAYVRRKKKQGWIIILNTLRDKNNRILGPKPYCEAITFCREHNIPIDIINDNLKEATDHFGYARKISAERYIDDRNVGFIGWLLRLHKNKRK